MSTNKVDRSKLDDVQQHRTAYQPDSNTHRVDAVNTVYTSTIYTYNVDGSASTIQYLYDSECEITNVVTVADVLHVLEELRADERSIVLLYIKNESGFRFIAIKMKDFLE